MASGNTSAAFYRIAADAILFLHAAFVAFVVLGLVLVLVGAARGWGWVRNPWLRHLHLAAIGIVVLQAWLGRVCPLTLLESALRERAGEATYSGAFVAHWVEAALYYRAPEWVFVVAYTLFAAAVVFCWFRIRPRAFTGRKRR